VETAIKAADERRWGVRAQSMAELPEESIFKNPHQQASGFDQPTPDAAVLKAVQDEAKAIRVEQPKEGAASEEQLSSGPNASTSQANGKKRKKKKKKR